MCLHKIFLRTHSIKFRYSEKATKNENNLPLCFDISRKFRGKVGDLFKFCGLLTISELYYITKADYTPATEKGLLKKTVVKLVVK